MSTDEEIQEVYLSDIKNKTKQVVNKVGIASLYDYFQDGFEIKKLVNLKPKLSNADRQRLEELLKQPEIQSLIKQIEAETRGEDDR